MCVEPYGLLLVVVFANCQSGDPPLPQIRMDKDHVFPGNFKELDDVADDGEYGDLKFLDSSDLTKSTKIGRGEKDKKVTLPPGSGAVGEKGKAHLFVPRDRTDPIFSTAKCGDEAFFKKICTSACSSLLISEFGYCGDHINFTKEHFELDHITVTLGCIFDNVEDEQVNYTLAIVDGNYTLQYLFFFNDIKPLAFDWVMHGHHNVLEIWDGLKRKLATENIPFSSYRQREPEIWRVLLFEFADRGLFPFMKPVPPFIYDHDFPLLSKGSSIVSTGYYCVSING